MSGEIHDEHPFATPMELRDPVRRFRGRLAAPVTIVTAGDESSPTGLTISSLIVAEGEPSFVHFLCGTATDLWYAIEEHGRFVVHILEDDHRELSDRFAGIRPSPGGLFAGLDHRMTDYGPAITALRSRAYCRYEDRRDDPQHALVHGVIDRVELHDLRDPLRYFRGEYFTG
ncbi:MAG: flavin reductase family protein [Acidimicrobiia bacterium]|nr:flavin reductase family protein [Acidimicrobiia bacterium]